MNRIQDEKFYCDNGVTYPPFKNGKYLEEYFVQQVEKENYHNSRKLIPAFWTNFQIKDWFIKNKDLMQKKLDEWVNQNPSFGGYYVVVQYDDACLLRLPQNTIIYGCCSGNVPLPLIYEDKEKRLENQDKIEFKNKKYFCSFVGCLTSNDVKPDVRRTMNDFLKQNNKYTIIISGTWTPNVDKNKQNTFIQYTKNSKFALAPRGYGRSSFRFFEIFKLGTIPIYLWNDIEWLPFKDIIDYSKICISINIKDIEKLDNILSNIDEKKYNEMLEEYNKIKHLFTYEGVYEELKKRN